MWSQTNKFISTFTWTLWESVFYFDFLNCHSQSPQRLSCFDFLFLSRSNIDPSSGVFKKKLSGEQRNPLKYNYRDLYLIGRRFFHFIFFRQPKRLIPFSSRLGREERRCGRMGFNRIITMVLIWVTTARCKDSPPVWKVILEEKWGEERGLDTGTSQVTKHWLAGLRTQVGNNSSPIESL